MLLRSIRPPDYDDSDIVPNPNVPAANPPASVGPDQLVNPGDPDGVETPAAGTTSHLPAIVPSLWSGYPSSLVSAAVGRPRPVADRHRVDVHRSERLAVVDDAAVSRQRGPDARRRLAR